MLLEWERDEVDFLHPIAAIATPYNDNTHVVLFFLLKIGVVEVFFSTSWKSNGPI